MKISHAIVVAVAPLAALFIAGAAPAWAQSTTAPSTGQPVSHNEELERRVLANLLVDKDLKKNHIEVTVEGSEATLKGKIDSETERSKAVRLAEIPGITVVHDQLEVGSEGVKEAITDAAITTKLRAQYLEDSTLRHASVSVSTNNGVVTLEGSVPTRAAHGRAVSLASHSRGVTRVEDRLQVSAK
jgi:osmotically-inducible protein OsmY